jgi:glycosyltransferase involved in cell wall biosynthesis
MEENRMTRESWANAGEPSERIVSTTCGPDTRVDPDLVSVIIPAFNAEKFIGKTLRSVTDQSYRNLEVIVVDDGSQDGTASIVEDIAHRDGRVRLIRQKNAGVGAARNRAIADARGAFIAPIDADDLWRHDKIALQVEALRDTSPRVALAYCWSLHIDEHDLFKSGVRSPCRFEGDVFSEMAARNFIGNGSAPLIRQSAICEVGGYVPDRKLQACADWILYIQLAERGEFVLVPDVLVGYRRLPGGMSMAGIAMEKSWDATAKWIRERYPRLSRKSIRQQTYYGYADFFQMALKSRAFARALRCIIVAAMNGPVRSFFMLLSLLRGKAAQVTKRPREFK